MERQYLQLVSWLKRNKLAAIPIESIIAITNSYALIKTAPTDQRTRNVVMYSIQIPSRVDQFYHKNRQVIFTNKDLRKISRLLIKHNEPYDSTVLNRFGIHTSALNKGCHCPHCSTLPMNRIRGKWTCMKCSYSSKNAHYAALKDYTLLIHPTITNYAFREFLSLPSTSIASKLLVAMTLSHCGTTKGRIYDLSFDEE
ncbi:hypothetical protein ACIQZI_18665 [Peribacillus sp. NPDC096379]|uniref:hypothetical protein n=1 Tax=Peribacillus sp. NPDC096379 TaxID=3364393 RepID=UPI00382923B5